MLRRYLKIALWLFLPVGLLGLLLLLKTKTILNVKAERVQYVGNPANGYSILVESRLDCHLARPEWWPDLPGKFNNVLKLESALLTDSNNQNQSVVEIHGTQYFVTGKSPTETKQLGHVSYLQLPKPCNLTRGGQLVVNVHVIDAPEEIGPYWVGSYVISLPPTAKPFRLTQKKRKQSD